MINLKRVQTEPIYNTNAIALLFLSALVLLGLSYGVASLEVRPATQLIHDVPVTIMGHTKTWAQEMGSKSTGYLLYLDCVYDVNCKKALKLRPVTYFAYALWFLTGLIFFVAFVFALMAPKVRDKMADAKWLKADPSMYPEVLDYLMPLPSDKAGMARLATLSEVDRPLVPIGQIIEQVGGPDLENPQRQATYRYKNLRTMWLSSKMLQEHLVVQGATGTGKTSRFLNHLLQAFAERGDAVVVPDFKFPDPTGLMHVISLFTAYNRPVYAAMPYDDRSIRIPVLSSLNSIQEARLFAETLMPTDAYTKQAGEYYQLAQQEILAIYMFHVAKQRPEIRTMKEVIRLTNMGSEAALEWAISCGDKEAQDTFTRILTDDKKAWGGYITGIRNALAPFMDDRIARMFTEKEGQNFDPYEFVEKGGLFFIGLPTDLMRSRHGRTVMRVIDTWTMNSILMVRRERTEKNMPKGKSVRFVYDEASQIGRMMNMLENSAANRGQDISMIFGIQDRVQMEVVYGESIWAAIDANIGTQVLFPTGVRDTAAERLSKWLGERELFPPSRSRSYRTGTGLPGTMQGKSESYSIRTVPLASPQVISEWPKFIAIVRTKGTLPQALCAMLPTFDPKPSYYGLDNKSFTLDNTEAYTRWTDVMGRMSDTERRDEVMAILDDLLPPADDTVRLVDTLTEEYGLWMQAVTQEGVDVRPAPGGNNRDREDGGKYQINYLSFPTPSEQRTTIDVRNPQHIRDYVREGWLAIPPQQLEDSETWEWITVTKAGMQELAKDLARELENARYNLAYIRVRRMLERTGNVTGVRHEAAREVLPLAQAVDTTKQLLREIKVLGDETLDLAVELVFNRFSFEQAKTGEQLVAIPLTTRFDQLLPKAVKDAEDLVARGAIEEDLPDLKGEKLEAVQRLRRKYGIKPRKSAEEEEEIEGMVDAALLRQNAPSPTQEMQEPENAGVAQSSVGVALTQEPPSVSATPQTPVVPAAAATQEAPHEPGQAPPPQAEEAVDHKAALLNGLNNKKRSKGRSSKEAQAASRMPQPGPGTAPDRRPSPPEDDLSAPDAALPDIDDDESEVWEGGI